MHDEPYRALKESVIGRTFRPGLVLPVNLFTGMLDTQWLVADADDDGTLNISGVGAITYPPFASFVDTDGVMVTYNPSPSTTPEVGIVVPDDNTWRSVVVRAAWTTRGRGRLTLTSGSATITGAGTAFARMSALADIPAGLLKQPTKIRIDSGGANDGDYSVNTVASETSLTITENMAATETVNEGDWYEVGYWYSTATPTSDAAYQRAVPEFELVTLVVTPATGDYVLCDVKRDSGSTPECTFRDRRAENRWMATPYVPEVFPSLEGAAAILPVSFAGVLNENEAAFKPGEIRVQIDSDAGEYVTGIDSSARYVAYATWDGAAAKLYRASRLLADAEEITLTTSTSAPVAVKADGRYIVIAYGQKVECFDHDTLESLWVYDHGGTVSDLALGLDEVYLCGLVGTGTKYVRAITLSTGLVLWSYNHGAAVYAITTDGVQVYIGGGTGTGSKEIRALLATDGSVVWSIAASDPVLRRGAVCCNDRAVYYVLDGNTIYSANPVTGATVATYTESNWQAFQVVTADDAYVYAGIADVPGGPGNRRVVAFERVTLNPIWSSTLTIDTVDNLAIAADGAGVFVAIGVTGATDLTAARLATIRGARTVTRSSPGSTYGHQRQLVVLSPQ